MRTLFLIPAILFSATAFAQQAAPVDPAANFPANAITSTTIGDPEAPATPDAGAKAAVPASPTSPANPQDPISDLWPANTVPVFMISCTNYHKELIEPCRCVITNLVRSMSHREFMEATEKEGGIERDSRYIHARQMCMPQPKRK